jgi:hypothetical protein
MIAFEGHDTFSLAERALARLFPCSFCSGRPSGRLFSPYFFSCPFPVQARHAAPVFALVVAPTKSKTAATPSLSSHRKKTGGAVRASRVLQF